MPRRGRAPCPALIVATVSALMSTPMTWWPLLGELGGERQPDLAEADDGDLHAWLSTSSTVDGPALAGRLDAGVGDGTVARPSRMVTMSVDWPSTASRKFSCSTRSGSGLAIAKRSAVALGHATERRDLVPLGGDRCRSRGRSGRRAGCRRRRRPCSPVTTVTRSLSGDSQLTRWLATVPSAI